MKTRYFKDARCVWKFEPGKPVMVRMADDSHWMDSIFTSVDELLDDPGSAVETSEEEGES